jgi:hypothetical protein
MVPPRQPEVELTSLPFGLESAMIDGAIVIEESELSAFTACREVDYPIG